MGFAPRGGAPNKNTPDPPPRMNDLALGGSDPPPRKNDLALGGVLQNFLRAFGAASYQRHDSIKILLEPQGRGEFLVVHEVV